MEPVLDALTQMHPDQQKMVLGTTGFAVFFILTLVFGFFGALVVGSALLAALFFADSEYHWSERVLEKSRA